MSEYQYYRFESVDGHLDTSQRAALRAISSRADITASSFQVHYHYSGLKAAPADVVLNYFDIGFYFADWGSIDAYIKLPLGTIPGELLQTRRGSFQIVETDEWLLLIFSLEEYGDYFAGEDADDFFQYLALLRAELMQGDWRLLYFMWLKDLDYNEELASIPLINFNFNNLSEAQHAFVSLFDIPLGLLKAVSLVLAEKPSHHAQHVQLDAQAWLKQLAEEDKNTLLVALFELGQLSRSQALVMTKKQQEREETVYKYWLNATVLAPYIAISEQQLKQEQAIAQTKKLAVEKAAKEEKLTQLYNKRDSIWQNAEQQASRACASGYDNAFNYLHQLAEAYQFKTQQAAFELRFKRFVIKHQSRKALLKRLKNLLVAQ
ncbi:hypothetical protein [Paraglaciecola sp.]|uniref:hypothetical protein n=1 Tax=Paraglaciecola sp. TaxID=1920173 RepID=UPI0030F42290